MGVGVGWVWLELGGGGVGGREENRIEGVRRAVVRRDDWERTIVALEKYFAIIWVAVWLVFYCLVDALRYGDSFQW